MVQYISNFFTLLNIYIYIYIYTYIHTYIHIYIFNNVRNTMIHQFNSRTANKPLLSLVELESGNPNCYLKNTASD